MLSKQKLIASVQVIEKNGLSIVRLKDIPNPYRSEFASDLYGSGRPIFDDEPWSFYVHDWDVWVRHRFKKNYQLSFPNQYKLLTDEDVSIEPMNNEIEKIEIYNTKENCLYVEKTNNCLIIKFNDVVYLQKKGDVAVKDTNNIIDDECITYINTIFEKLEECYSDKTY